jgi:porphobilinogen deaminase
LAAGCSAPVGAYAAGTEILQLRAVVAALDGGSALRASATAPAAEAGRLGCDVATELLRQGAAAYVAVASEYFSNGDDAS